MVFIYMRGVQFLSVIIILYDPNVPQLRFMKFKLLLNKPQCLTFLSKNGFVLLLDFSKSHLL